MVTQTKDEEIVTAAIYYVLLVCDEDSLDEDCDKAAISLFVLLPPEQQDAVCDDVPGFGPNGERIREMDQDKLFDYAERLAYTRRLN